MLVMDGVECLKILLIYLIFLSATAARRTFYKNTQEAEKHPEEHNQRFRCTDGNRCLILPLDSPFVYYGVG